MQVYLAGQVRGHLPVLPQIIFVPHQNQARVCVTFLKIRLRVREGSQMWRVLTFLYWCLLVMYLWAMLAVW